MPTARRPRYIGRFVALPALALAGMFVSLCIENPARESATEGKAVAASSQASQVMTPRAEDPATSAAALPVVSTMLETSVAASTPESVKLAGEVDGGTLVVTLMGFDITEEPSAEAPKVVRLKTGTPLLIIGPITTVGAIDWVPVVDPATDAAGWLPTIALGPPAEPDTRIGEGSLVVTGFDAVTLHRDPSFAGQIVGRLERRHPLLVIGEPVEAEGFTWLPVRDSSTGVQAWVRSENVLNESLAIEHDGGTLGLNPGSTDPSGFTHTAVPDSPDPDER